MFLCFKKLAYFKFRQFSRGQIFESSVALVRTQRHRLRPHLEGHGAVTALRPTPYSVSSPTPGELGSRHQKRGCIDDKVGRCQGILDGSKGVAFMILILMARQKLPGYHEARLLV